jgi:hypothetical protein
MHQFVLYIDVWCTNVVYKHVDMVVEDGAKTFCQQNQRRIIIITIVIEKNHGILFFMMCYEKKKNS